MANMSYCRFENTYRDLQDCYYNIDGELSAREHVYREQLIDLCKALIDRYEERVYIDNEN
jgi:hypothetical protein